MNPLKKLLNLLPTQSRFYGQITSINGDLISITLLGGGMIQFRNAQYARTIAVNVHVWVSPQNGTFTLEEAPSMSSVQILV